jgi:DNA-binding NtrC family response regulator
MVNLRQQAKRLASQNDLILIYGESGVGKEVFARFIHLNSENNRRNFVKATVSSFSKELLAKELFGFEEQDNVRYGLLDEANSGCLYLSDIAALPLDVQLQLSSALREGFYTRVGGTEHIGLSLKLVVSSQHDLHDDVEAGLFDIKLYAALNIAPLMIPGLREHPEDVPELLNYYVDKLTEQDNLPYRHFSVAAQNYLRNYPWFGNIRELRNLVQRLLIMGTDVEITEEEVEESLGEEVAVFSSPITETPEHLFDLSLRQAREQFEHDYLIHHLSQVNGNVSKLSDKVQMERTHLYRKMRSLGIDPKQYGK